MKYLILCILCYFRYYVYIYIYTGCFMLCITLYILYIICYVLSITCTYIYIYICAISLGGDGGTWALICTLWGFCLASFWSPFDVFGIPLGLFGHPLGTCWVPWAPFGLPLNRNKTAYQNEWFDTLSLRSERTHFEHFGARPWPPVSTFGEKGGKR